MRILIVSQHFWPEDFKVNDIAFQFAKEGHQITVLTAKPNYPKGKFYKGYGFFKKRKEIIEGVEIIRTPIFPRLSGKPLFLILNYLSFIFFSFFTSMFRVRGSYDIIFSHLTSPITSALPAIWLKQKMKIPLVIWVLDLWPESVESTTNIKNKYFYHYLNNLVSFIYGKSDEILVSSRCFIESVKKKLKNPQIPVTYFPNWAEDVFTSGPDKEVKLPDLPKGFNIMFAGNIGEAQDFESIVKAAKETENYDINWIIIGEGRKHGWLKKEITENNINNVKLLGRHPINTMPAFFEKADTMLVSLKNEPIFRLTVPAKIQAYMASGKIILAMINGEANNLITESKCGYAVSASDYHELAKMAIRLRNTSALEKKDMMNNAKMYYAKFFAKKMLFERLETILLEKLEKK